MIIPVIDCWLLWERSVQDPNKPVRLEFKASVQGGGPFTKFLAAIAGLAVIVAGLFLSVFVFAGLLLAGVVAGGWFWWRTRTLRRQLRESIDAATRQAVRQADQRENAGNNLQGTVIDGDFIRAKPDSEPVERK